MTIPVGVIYALWSLVQDVGVFSRVFGRVLINKDFDRMILILNNLCKVLNMFFKWIIAFPIHIHGCQLLVIKWIDIDLSSSPGVVKCCVIIGLSNLTSLGPTFPVKWGNIYKKILPLELFVHIVTSHIDVCFGDWYLRIFDTDELGFTLCFMTQKSPPFSSSVILWTLFFYRCQS